MINEANIQTQDVPAFAFAYAFDAVKREVDRILSTSPKPIREYTSHLKQTQGKFIRAYSVLACAMGEDDLVSSDAVLVAAAVEILHLATLVHDDVIDDAPVRRGTTTLHRKYDRKTAVICGDYLFSAALRQFFAIPNKNKYQDLSIEDYIGRICIGELRQHINNFNLDLSVLSYLRIISGKTAALFEASFLGGAAVLQAHQTELKQYRRLGRYIGMIFQLSDDCIDYAETESNAKKPVKSDFEQGVITLPLIYAMQQSADLKNSTREQKMAGHRVAEEVIRMGGLVYTRSVAGSYYHKALKILAGLGLSEQKMEKLQAVLNQAYGGSKVGTLH